MTKNMKKMLALMLALTMAASLAACGSSGGSAPATTAAAEEEATEAVDGEEATEAVDGEEAAEEEVVDEAEEEVVDEEGEAAEVTGDLESLDPAMKAAEGYPTAFDPEGWTDESKTLYDATLGDFYAEYQKALETDNISERFALMAAAEAKMLETAVMIPLTTRGGRYGISRVAPYSVNTTLWGNDSDRFHNAIVTTEPILPADRDEMKEHWKEVRGTGEYEAWAKEYLTGKGYEIKDTYNYPYNADPVTWDALGTSRAADSEAIVNTYDGLMEYDLENEQQPALATEYTVSDDGLTYTFKLREGVNWVDSQGRTVAEVKADDFVAGMQHMMDAMGGLEYLVGAEGCNIKNADAYIAKEISDFAEVGVKAVDDYTVEYTLEAPCPFFTTMLSYNVFAPMSRAYYESQGGKFGADFSADDPGYLYGTDPDHIAYCGPYLVTNATEKNTIVFKANDAYWNKDNINIKTLTWLFNDGTDETKAYNDTIAAVIDGCSLSPAALEAAKKDGNFEKFAYVTSTDATSYMGFLNINRKAFANFNDNSVAVSEQTVGDARRTAAAMQNLHFRRALVSALDRASYNAQTEGEELKLNSLRNCYTPGTFVSLTEDTTIDINGTATTFPAGTYYGAIMQAQLDADEIPFKVWDPEGDGGVGSSDGFDGWYNPEFAKAELATAVEELADIEISAENPIQIDVAYFSGSEQYTNRANVLKQSLEGVSEGMIQVNLIPCESAEDWYYSGYYTDYGYEMNGDLSDVSGWGPDYGDPQTYLATLAPDYAGYMVKTIGMY